MDKETFECLQVSRDAGEYRISLQQGRLDDLSAGQVVIAVEYSSLNYKDALAVTGRGKILRRLPLIPGIDLAGRVIASEDPGLNVGDGVVVTGCGLGENHDGGFSQLARVPADWVVPLPDGLSTREAMIYGTAGFTAALAIHRMQVNGQVPEMGTVVVTGASGGVGSLAVSMLAQLGYEVCAVSAKADSQARLKALGAQQVVEPQQLELGPRPLESVRYAGAIDNVGGKVLAGLLRHINLYGNVASVGLAESMSFEATVMPMILRGVSLLGISSANCPMALRRTLWGQLASSLKPPQLEDFVSDTIGLAEVEQQAQAMLDRRTSGRTLLALR